MIPINTIEFTDLKRVGIVAEIAVCECVHLNNHLRTQLHNTFDVDMVIATTRVKLDAPYDIDMWTFKTGIDSAQSKHTIEVKSANNGGRYPTFYAEIYQTASRGYTEYLVHPPSFMVYVDLVSNMHYWYDGPTFVDAVKANWANRQPNRRGSAFGVRFKTRSKEYGFKFVHVAPFMPSETYRMNKDAIEHRIDTTQDKQTFTYKICTGLPDLNDKNVI